MGGILPWGEKGLNCYHISFMELNITKLVAIVLKTIEMYVFREWIMTCELHLNQHEKRKKSITTLKRISWAGSKMHGLGVQGERPGFLLRPCQTGCLPLLRLFCVIWSLWWPLEPQLQSILLWLLWRWGLMNYLPELASNLNPPDLSLPSS
jgi:hypothetical protein